MNPVTIAIVLGLLAILYGFVTSRQVLGSPAGSEKMQEIAAAIQEGAQAYLKRQYSTIAIVGVVVAVIIALTLTWVSAIGFVLGAVLSGVAGFIGMNISVRSNVRTATAAQTGLQQGLTLAFRAGAITGMLVAGLALLAIAVFYWYLTGPAGHTVGGEDRTVVEGLTALAFGASLISIFARLGGGIFTKAADVGADLVGKVEAGIPEDDPRNPATIADNVGDNVGDVAGMGADLYESYCGSILATAALGAAAFMGAGDTGLQYKAVIAPMLVAAVGTILSLAGIYLVRVKRGATQRQLLGALGRGINFSSLLIVIASWFLLHWLGLPNPVGIWGAIVTGLVTGIVIGKSTEYYTSQQYKPTQGIARHAGTGPATVIIAGMGVGFISTVIPVLAIVVGTTLAYAFAAGGFDFGPATMSLGLYGIGIAAVGMLSTLGLTLATDAYGPIADNAGGNAEMSGLGPEVRRRTDALDSLGNTTAATGKGFAIGSAALTALALLASYVEELKIALLHHGTETLTLPTGDIIATTSATLTQFMDYYQVTLMNPKVLLGLFLGAMMSFVFCGLTMNAVGRAAGRMVEEVRRQFKALPGILTGADTPDYARCVAISTAGAQREMIVPSLLAVAAPILTGLVFGVPGVFGLLAGSLSSGFVLAIFMANSGGAWDNAKKFIEEGHHGGKGSSAHKAAVIGDTVGDPFKDTSGPSLNILIKLMSMVSIVTAGVNVAWTLF